MSRRKKISIILAVLLLLPILGWLLLPKGPRDPLPFADPWRQPRPLLRAGQHAVVAGTPWAAETALEVLEQGGNAVDAAIAGLLMLYVTHGEASGFPGIMPTLLYHAGSDTVLGYVGVGVAPGLATRQRMLEAGFEHVPEMHLWAQLVPAAPDGIVALLQAYGSRSFAELAAPAIRQARQGFPVHQVMAKNLDLSLAERIGYSWLMPSNAEVYLKGQWWRPIHHSDRFTRPDLAQTFERMAAVEQAALATGASRGDALQALRDFCYRGEMASAIVQYHQQHQGLIRQQDLSNYRGKWERPIVGHFGPYRVYVSGCWSQGIALAEMLHILEPMDLQGLGHNSVAYVHLLAQVIELAMMDREAYVGDPDFVQVPVDSLLSAPFARRRRRALSEQAFDRLPPPGSIGGLKPYLPAEPPGTVKAAGLKAGDDTSQIVVVDSAGNAVAITPSDFPMTPIIPGWDLTLGNRMTQFRLQANHPAVLQPGKRPRVTPQAVMVFKGNDFYMALNTPGGDNQLQALLQVLLNHLVFGMDIQRAIDQPRFKTSGFPSSFSPHSWESARLLVEAPLYEAVAAGLGEKGYKLKPAPRWGIDAGVGAVMRAGSGLLAGSDPRAETTAKGR
ncbi:MAG: gamma-glutamyltransferase family protein [Bacteroidetes bacterium]|nr:MAG: gamma-glutamyltransferase family protein [Bacteroidota bacterium]